MTDLRLMSGQDLQDMGLGLLSLLQIMAADGHLHEAEQTRIREFGRTRGFEARYVDEIIATALTNTHLSKVPPTFNSQVAARDFLRSARDLALCDGHLHPNEEAWLTSFAKANGIS